MSGVEAERVKHEKAQNEAQGKSIRQSGGQTRKRDCRIVPWVEKHMEHHRTDGPSTTYTTLAQQIT
jgi:hypothetical protein